VIRVLLVDDQPLVRVGLRVLLGGEDDIEVVGEAANGSEAVTLTRTSRPDVVMMDLLMPGVDGVEATRRISGDPALAGVRVLVLTTFDLDEYVFAALRAGASGFVVKDAEPAELLYAVRVVARGESLLAPQVTRRLIDEFVSRERPGSAGPADPGRAAVLERLTEREREVLVLVAQGLNNDEIAQRLYISPATARTHVSRMIVKLDTRDRIQLVVLAYQCGLVQPR
jgi:DNA-binding NarL/FixJ family response regulator